MDGSEIRLKRKSAYMQLSKIQYLFVCPFILWEKLLIEAVSPVQVPEFRKLNLYVNNKKTDLYRYLHECMKLELHACISNCRTTFACKSSLVLKN